MMYNSFVFHPSFIGWSMVFLEKCMTNITPQTFSYLPLSYLLSMLSKNLNDDLQDPFKCNDICIEIYFITTYHRNVMQKMGAPAL